LQVETKTLFVDGGNVSRDLVYLSLVKRPIGRLFSSCLHNAHALLFTAYDFTSSDLKHYNMVLQYNPDESNVLRVPRLMNLVMFVS
jgi:hypothetical protein